MFYLCIIDCLELFVTLVHVYICSMKGELLYCLFDGFKGFLNQAY